MTEQGQPQVAEAGTTRRRTVLGLVLVLVGLGLFFPGIPILVLLDPAQLMERWLADLFAKLIIPLIWCLPIIGLGLHARTHGRTILWALAGWFPLLGPLLALVAMRIWVRKTAA